MAEENSIVNGPEDISMEEEPNFDDPEGFIDDIRDEGPNKPSKPVEFESKREFVSFRAS
jgi:hypothetical protein